MKGAQQKVSTFDGEGGKGAAELNHGTRNEHKEVRGGIAGDGQGLSEEDESRINVAAMDVKEPYVLEASIMAHNPVLEKQQYQSTIPMVQWDRFLPLRTLKVLLVENDDSTRQVVSALLRNCCYEVTAVANPLEAWRILEDLKNHIDLVLTEVVMPYVSGVGLLCKIMSHKTRKSIPVIMMSSNDSMGIVFKCLSKGAADFLVKPIRKNELKNLWQHVWRRCHSSCGSGSGSVSGIQGQKFTSSKSEDDSDNNTDSNDEDDNGSFGWNARDGSDNGSGTQNSWTKCANEVDSPQSLPPSKQLSSPHDSTCAQVILPRPCMDCKEQNKIADDIMGKDLEIGGILMNKNHRNESHQTDKVSTELTGPVMEKSPENGRNVDVFRHASCNVPHRPSAQAANQLYGISDNSNQQYILTSNTTKASSKMSENKDDGYIDSPSFKLGLKRLRSAGEVGIASSDEKNVLKRSNLSAFSRYPSSIASVQAPTGCGGSSSLNRSEAAPLKQGSNGSSGNNDLGSTNRNCVTRPGVYKEVSTSTIKCNHPASAFHPVQPKNSTIQKATQEKIDEAATIPVIGQSNGSQKEVQVQHHHHHYHHHHHHHVHALPSQPDQVDSSLENLKETVAFCSSSNVITGPVEANAANYNSNGSNSSSKHDSDGHNACSAAINLGETNMESASCLAEKGNVGGGDRSGCGSGTVDQNRSAQREAALNKFRQKRKARNFSKKVRYQSRKRLAEQRPRSRGQFVRRIVQDESHLAENAMFD